MRKILFAVCIFMLALSGCRSVGTMTRNITGSDDALVAQLSEEQLAPVDEARFHLNVANEEVSLSELKQELADYRADIAAFELSLAKNRQERQEIELDIAQEKALSQAGMREPGESAKNLAAYNDEHMSNESKRYDIEAKIKKVQLRVEDLTARIEAQEQRVASMSYSTPVASPVAQPPTSDASTPSDAGSGTVDAEVKSQDSKEGVELPDYLKVEEDSETTNGGDNGYEVEEGALSN
ncbi:hypothetical protein [Pseudodesulfovibrio senegalensis]|uniref:Lipoprotein n=1 Tax=Pseudodesulfovibrio senegalensis TaxID=1721087 RepID=A0A6N6N919_9BACT|nr:hypothetical protein [Pseudodesulfovibrio senegalensis]KAB1443387.1 hypothetical protein F8A88_03780 [Pseudodesulfovibrio senegalensis]